MSATMQEAAPWRGLGRTCHLGPKGTVTDNKKLCCVKGMTRKDWGGCIIWGPKGKLKDTTKFCCVKKRCSKGVDLKSPTLSYVEMLDFKLKKVMVAKILFLFL